MTTAVAEAKNLTELLAKCEAQYRSGACRSFVPILPMLSLKGKPYSLLDYAPFEPLYKLDQPRRAYFKSGRQVAKTTNMAALSVLQVGTQPHFSLLFVAPRYEQVRRISANYVRPFIDQSAIAKLLQNKGVENSVLQKSFLNNSRMYFSFAFLDVDRIRGLSVDGINYDEVQDIDVDFLPIIRECMTASKFGIEKYFGTPKTLDNTLQVLWERSSQAEWHIKCGCGKDNIPAASYDLLKMIGPNGPICASCGSTINPRTGRWVHAIAENIAGDAGYHIPQIILPLHYENPKHPGVMPKRATEKWLDLLKKRDSYDNTKFMNEVLGESSDVGVKLVTLTDIRNASVLNKNVLNIALQFVSKYAQRVLAVDWSGGGEDGLSTTTYALVGRNVHNGKIECFYTARLNAALGHYEEAKQLLELFKMFNCHIFAHDFGGAGTIRETVMVQAGLPIDRIMPLVYVRASVKKMVEYRRPIEGSGERPYYSLDKARSLVLQATALKVGHILLPEYESSKDITHDLLALMEDRRDVPSGADIFLIRRNAKLVDDFAHALNYGCIAIWHAFQCYPDLSKLVAIKLTPQQMNFANPPNVTFE